MARTVADVAAMLSVIAGYDELDPRSVPHDTPLTPGAAGEGLAGITIGVPTNFFFENLEAETEDAVRRAISVLGELGAIIRDVTLPEAELASARSNPIIWAEAFAVHRTRIEEHPELFGADTRTRLGLGERVTGAEFADALQGMYEWQRSISRVFADVDIIATPTTARGAPRIEDVETVGITADLVRLNHQWSLAHVPALVVPCGFTSEALPIGLQLAAAKWHDATVLRTGLEYQAATDWHLRQPDAVLVGSD
jgi:aspartyl-tRNA(Asn)/glutamyl-tRNA(Gln) amidotransferase subunit A